MIYTPRQIVIQMDSKVDIPSGSTCISMIPNKDLYNINPVPSFIIAWLEPVENEITIRNVRNLTYTEAETEINNYIMSSTHHNVSAAELAEHLCIDIAIIDRVMAAKKMDDDDGTDQL